MSSLSRSVRRAKALLGTVVEIAVSHDCEQSELNQIVDSAFDVVALINQLMSVHQDSSDVSLLNKQAYQASVKVHPWTYQVLTAAENLNQVSGGVFDITIGRDLLIAGFIENDFLLPGNQLSKNDNYPVQLIEDNKVRFSDDVIIDLSGIAKGFAVDKAVEMLLTAGVESGIVNAGGDLRCFGTKIQQIALRDPENPSRLFESLQIKNLAVASSSPTLNLKEKQGELLSPLLDGRSRQMIDSNVSITVSAPSCMIADALTKVAINQNVDLQSVLSFYHATAYKILNGEIYIAEGNYGRSRPAT